jgi:hypothetical protein
MAYVGQNPTVPQRLLVERACMMTLRLAQIDRKIVNDEPFTLIDNNCTIAWQNALTRCLVALGIHKEAASVFPQTVPPLPDHLASIMAE